MSREIRWVYRFENFSRAYHLLHEALENGVEALGQLECKGVVQRFEYTLESPFTKNQIPPMFDDIAIKGFRST